MWKDSETNIDYLNIGHIVNMLSNLILDDNLTPAIIGVYGAWGSGKSSVLKMSEELLNKDKDILCIKFNSWMFEDYYDIRAALISSIIQDIVNYNFLLSQKKFMQIIQNGGVVKLHSYEWVNKSSGRGDTELIVADGSGVEKILVSILVSSYTLYKGFSTTFPMG